MQRETTYKKEHAQSDTMENQVEKEKLFAIFGEQLERLQLLEINCEKLNPNIEKQVLWNSISRGKLENPETHSLRC